MKKMLSLLLSIFILAGALAACNSASQINYSQTNNNSANTIESIPTEGIPTESIPTESISTEDIPAMLIKYFIGASLHEITAWQGIANWFFYAGDGTTGGILTDSLHPLQAINHLPVIDRIGGAAALLDLSFESTPDYITARRWVASNIENRVLEDADFLNYKSVFVAGKTIYISDSDNSYIYEVTAHWLHPGLESFVTYAFYVTNSLPVDGPRRTPLLYVSVTVEGSPIQHFQTLQLSNSWSPIKPDGLIRPGYCASSVHPLDVWALDFLAWLDWDDDAVTIKLNGASGEIELIFSDDFPPHTVYARRWPAKFSAPVNDGGADMDLWFQYEPVEINGNIIRINDDGSDYIYEIDAIWPQGRSSYTFRVDSAN